MIASLRILGWSAMTDQEIFDQAVKAIKQENLAQQINPICHSEPAAYSMVLVNGLYEIRAFCRICGVSNSKLEINYG